MAAPGSRAVTTVGRGEPPCGCRSCRVRRAGARTRIILAHRGRSAHGTGSTPAGALAGRVRCVRIARFTTGGGPRFGVVGGEPGGGGLAALTPDPLSTPLPFTRGGGPP